MKKLFILSLATLGFVACSKRADYVVLSGKIDGTNGMPFPFRIIGGEVNKELKIQPDGSFRDTLRVPSNYYTLFNPQGIQVPLYLEQGDELGVNIDLSKMPLSIKFTGKDTVASAYLQKKIELMIKLENSEKVQELFQKNLSDFKTELNDIEKQYADFLKQAKKLPKEFIKKEEKENEYKILYLKQLYPSAHFRQTKQRIETPKEFSDALAKLDYDNAEDFKTYPSYQDLVRGNFFLKYEENENKEGKVEKNTWDILVDYIRGLKSKNIKEDLTNYIVNGISPSNPKETNDKLIAAIKEFTKDTSLLREIDRRVAELETFKEGTPFPVFKVEDMDGKTVSSESFKGKLLYIDIWATWCKPCLGEIEPLKALQEQYKDKNIAFVSISIDNTEDLDKWKAMVKEKALKGVQLHTDLRKNSAFAENYRISGIPRFILVSKEGTIINFNAPRPSEAKIKQLIDANL
nr:TlpA disulfide reductase family protein [uncultured Capnocytophaga sp.]